MGLYGQVKSQLNYPVPAVALAVQSLWFIMEKHGTKIQDLPSLDELGENDYSETEVRLVRIKFLPEIGN